MKIRGENCKRGCTTTFLRSAKAMELGEVDGWHTSVLTPVNEGVYAKQYENKDPEVQTTYA